MGEHGNSFLLFIAGNHQGIDHEIPAPVVIDKLLQRRYWVVEGNRRTPPPIDVGSKAVFYAAGGHGKFVAVATVTSTWAELDVRQYTRVLGELRYSFARPYAIPLANVKRLSQAVSARSLLERLSFTRNITRWGVFFRASMRPITKDDYEMIVGLGRPVAMGEVDKS